MKIPISIFTYIRIEELPLRDREAIAGNFSDQPEVGNTFFEPGDEWIDRTTGIAVDVMFRQMEWIEAQIDRVLYKHQASVGYSTCFWNNVLTSRVLFDRSGWYTALRINADQRYPEQLRRSIIEKNFPLLRKTQSSYVRQLERAIKRKDEVSIHHRITALLASYFDVLFAINRVPHPGEKRLVRFAETQCRRIPNHLSEQIVAFVHSGNDTKIAHANKLIDDLEKLLD